jgi:hypothetical protein
MKLQNNSKMEMNSVYRLCLNRQAFINVFEQRADEKPQQTGDSLGNHFYSQWIHLNHEI